MPNSQAKAIDQVREYYGQRLKGTRDLKTNACCSADALPPYQRDTIKLIDDEIIERFYGCGSPIPMAIEGAVILDLGCGTGRDVYLAARQAGPGGRVIGVDMTDEQIEIAARHIDGQMTRFGFLKPNVEFRKGYIEDLSGAGIEDASVDVVISNCVVNLSPDKRSVFSEIFRVLKPGGELFFADVFAGRRVPESLRDDPELHGECLGGAMYIEDFRRMLRDMGVPDYRVVSRSRIDLGDSGLGRRAGMVDFYSMTVRAFKLDNLEDMCEDYGQVAVYKGTIHESPHVFDLDDRHRFIAGKPMLVCGNTAAMLGDTRYAAHFEIRGGRTTHYGPFDCASAHERISSDSDGIGGACC